MEEIVDFRVGQYIVSLAHVLYSQSAKLAEITTRAMFVCVA